MNIVCPQCNFTRQVPEDRIPGASAMATCPQCQHRFKVIRATTDSASLQNIPASASPGETANRPTAQSTPQSAFQSPCKNIPAQQPEDDDPLPPGAIVPSHGDSLPPPPQNSANTNSAPHTRHGDSEPDTTQAAQSNAQAYQEKTLLDQSPAKKDALAEEEYRQAGLAAYRRQASLEDEVLLQNPWEHPEKEGYLASFYQTMVRVMFAAPRFFSGLNAETPLLRALICYLIVSVFQILIERSWGEILASVLAPATGSDPQLQNLLQMLAPQTNIVMTLLLRSALGTLELYLAAGIYFMAFKLVAPQNANYPLIFQVLAYSCAPALLCIVPVVGSISGLIWSIACGFVGCRYALRISWGQTAATLAPVYTLSIPLAYFVLKTVQGITG